MIPGDTAEVGLPYNTATYAVELNECCIGAQSQHEQ